MPHRQLAGVLTAFSPHSQAHEVMRTDDFLMEAHILTLAHFADRQIVVFQKKKKNQFNSEVDALHYGTEWAPPAKLTRQAARALIKDGAVPIHLDYPPTHFSALVPLIPKHPSPSSAASPFRRSSRRGYSTLTNGVVFLKD